MPGVLMRLNLADKSSSYSDNLPGESAMDRSSVSETAELQKLVNTLSLEHRASESLTEKLGSIARRNTQYNYLEIKDKISFFHKSLN
ncbi:hypothetical protein JOB18_002430 [Solea senegalensis]|uniref:Uncharacterized protein n=1 Tax=Solea senegalensis TaxID=28829 RepID=A0AAV6QV63_SOLSE|nr:hypothetical protein JOB18_002430 [Solea senegalensis]